MKRYVIPAIIATVVGGGVSYAANETVTMNAIDAVGIGKEIGRATKDVVAPHLKVSDVKGHSIMIHAGGDNYSDQPAPVGGGGARIACGVAK